MQESKRKIVQTPLLALLWSVWLLCAAGYGMATPAVIDTLICEGSVFQYHGHSYSEPGTYYDTVVTADGQMQIDTLRLHTPVITGATFLCINSEDSLFAPPWAEYYRWNTGDTTRCIRITEPGYYSVRLADDVNCFVDTRVTQSYNPVQSINMPEMCAGFPQPITIGYGNDYNIVLGQAHSHMDRADTIFLPDGIDCGSGCSYISSVTFSGFPGYDTIASVNDILYVKLSIEHEWIGDLWIQLTCPNGQHTSILKKYPHTSGQISPCIDSIPATEWGWSGSGSPSYKLGVPNFFNYAPVCDDSVNTMGTCRDYCWSEATNQGYVYSPGSYVYHSSNMITGWNNSLHNGTGGQQTLFCKPSNMANMTNIFRPDGSFSDLIGCPVNGEWKIEVMDGWSLNNGYLCGWEMALNGGMVYDGVVNDASSTSANMIQTDTTTFVVIPPNTLSADTSITFPVTLIDNNGCEYDTNFSILFHPVAQSNTNTEICQGDTLHYNGSSLTHDGNYSFFFPGSNGCDSVAYLHLMVNPSPRTEITDTACDSFVWNNITYSTSGDYIQYFQTAHGCDSIVTLHLTVNYSTNNTIEDTVCDSIVWNDSIYTQSGIYTHHFQTVQGCDSTVTLLLTVHHSNTYEWSETVCDSLVWNDSVYTQSGDYTQHFQNMNGCDSAATLHLIVHNSITTEWNDTVCDSLRWNNILYTTSGDYTQHFQTVNSCDSTVTLHLTVHHSTISGWHNTVCDSLRWNDVLYTESGNYTQHLQTAEGCDSTVILNLIVHHSAASEWFDTVCDSIVWNDSIYTQSGDYIQHFRTTHDCDSMVTLHLTVHHSALTEWSDTVCDSLTWNNVTYNTSGTYTQHLQTAHGCDSTVTLNLTVNYSTTSEWSDTVCNGIRWNDIRYTTSGHYVQHLQTEEGCDSTVTLNLVVHYSAATEWSDTACDSLTWNDSTYTQSGDHVQHFQTIHGCDSSVTLHLTIHNSVTNEWNDTICDSLVWNNITYTQSGDYTQHFQTVYGCDSTVTRHLVVNYSTTSAWSDTVCDSLRWNDVLYTASGNHIQYLQTEDGCDSVVTLHLTVHHSATTEWSDTVCDSLRWNDVLYTTSGDHIQHFQTSDGCDSSVTLHLTVHHSIVHEWSYTACDSLVWNDSVYTQSGDYIQHFQTAHGCDSTVTLHLAVHYSAAPDTIAMTACDSLRWNDVLYTASGQYTQRLQTIHGCDSTVTIQLVVNITPRTALYDTIIENALPYDTLGLHFTDAGVQTATLMAANGCDSIVTVMLEVLRNTFVTYDTSVCAAALPLNWHGYYFTGAGTRYDTLINPNGTSCYISTALAQYAQPTLSITDITHPACYGESTGSLTTTVTGGTAPYSYQWHENTTTGALLSSNSSSNGLAAGLYWIQVTDAHNCIATDSVSLHYLYGEMTPGHISSDQDVCEGNLASPLIGSEASGGHDAYYQWQMSTNGTTFVPAAGTNNAQSYTLDTVTELRIYRRAWISALCGTQYSNTVTIHSLPTPHDTIYANVCQDHVFDSLGFYVNAYDTHMPDTLIRINRAQTYYHCDSVVTLILSILPSAYDTLREEICQGDPYEANGFQIPADSTNTAGTFIFRQQLAQSDCGCDSTVVLELTVRPTYLIEIEDRICEGDGYTQHGFYLSPAQTIGTDHLQERNELLTQFSCDSIITLDLDITDTSLTIDTYPYDFCEEYSLTLTADSPLGNYIWNNGETNTSIEIHSPGYYSVTATDGECSAKTGITIQPCELNIFLPNAITPSNHDGLNDFFLLEEAYQRQISDFTIHIFDRWGNVVFVSSDKSFRWQGEQNGKIVPNTTYNYIITYKDLYGEPFTLKGSITIL